MPDSTQTGCIVLLLICHCAVVSGTRTHNLPRSSSTTDAIRDSLSRGCPNENHEYISTGVLTAMLEERLPTDRPGVARDHFDRMFHSAQKPEYDAYERAVERLLSSDGNITRADTPMPCGPYADVEPEVDLEQVFGHRGAVQYSPRSQSMECPTAASACVPRTSNFAVFDLSTATEARQVCEAHPCQPSRSSQISPQPHKARPPFMWHGIATSHTAGWRRRGGRCNSTPARLSSHTGLNLQMQRADLDHAVTILDHTAQVAVVTAVFGKRDILHPPAATAYPEKVCYVAFLDDVSVGFLKEKGFEVGDTCEGWKVG
jgi:hypothetical protein